MRRFAALLCVCACAHGPARNPGGDHWVEARSEHFVLRTDLAERAARELIAELEQVRAGFMSLSWRAKKTPPLVVPVTAFAESDDLAEFTSRGLVGFVSDDALGARRIVISAGVPVEENQILKHELAHAFNETFLLRQPRWLSEGMACYLETLRFRNGRVVIGAPDPDRVRYLFRYPLRDYGQVLDVGDEALAMTAERGYDYETRSWAIFHYLADQRRDQLDDFIHRLGRAEDPGSAFRAAFGAYPPAQLDKDVAQWLKAGRTDALSGPFERWHGSIAVRALSAAEIDAQRADLFRISPGREPQIGRAKTALEAALAADPGQPLALAVAARLGVEVDAHEAVRRHPDDERAWIALLQSLPEQSPERATAAAELLKRSPNSVRALRESAWSALAKNRAAEALAYAHRAATGAPGDIAALDVLTLALAANNRCAEADRMAHRALEVVPDGAVQALQALRARVDDVRRICETPRAATKADMAAPPVGYIVHVPPHAKKCSGTGPLVPAGVAQEGDAIGVRYLVRKNGQLAKVEKRSGSDALFAIVKSWLESCQWDAATDGGSRVESWGERTFTFR